MKSRRLLVICLLLVVIAALIDRADFNRDLIQKASLDTQEAPPRVLYDATEEDLSSSGKTD